MRMEQTTHAPGQLRRILPGVLLAAGLVWLMTGLFAPLTLGLLLAALMAPMAEALSRHTGCPRRLAAVGTMALFYLLLGLALTAAGSWAAGQGAQLLRQLPRLWNSSLLPALELLLPRLEEFSARYAPVTAPLVDWAAAALERSLPGLLSGLSSRAASLTARWLSRLPALLLGSVFTVILSFCIAADYPRLCTILRDKVPPGLTALLGELRYFGSRVLLRMLRAWAILSLVLLAVLSAGLWLLGVEHPLAAAFAITLLDLLPLIGSGMILLPWGLWGALPGPCCPGGGALAALRLCRTAPGHPGTPAAGRRRRTASAGTHRGALCRAAAGRGTGGYAASGSGAVPVGSGLPGEAALVPKGGHRQLTFLFQGSKKAPAPHRADAFGLFMPELSSRAGSPASSRPDH